MSMSLAEESLLWDAHAQVSCADGSHHWQLLIEGGRAGGVDTAGRFHFHEFEPAEPGRESRSKRRSVTIEQEEEGIRYGTPAEFRAIKGRVLANRVVGWVRFWSGPSRTPDSLHSRCGTGSATGAWLKFSLPRINGPAQPGGHWSPRSGASS